MMTDREMTNRELLELAAKVASKKIEYWHSNGSPMVRGEDGTPYAWNPIEDDGDTFRLAVAAGIDIQIMKNKAFWSDDALCKATRRAVVRSVAQIGKEMP